jgi:hypothetical protein
MKTNLSPTQDNRHAYREFDIDGKWGTRMLELLPVFKKKVYNDPVTEISSACQVTWGYKRSS